MTGVVNSLEPGELCHVGMAIFSPDQGIRVHCVHDVRTVSVNDGFLNLYGEEHVHLVSLNTVQIMEYVVEPMSVALEKHTHVEEDDKEVVDAQPSRGPYL